MFQYLHQPNLAAQKLQANIVELAVEAGELDAQLSRQIIGFHKSRQIEPRHGRRISIGGRAYFRWCFSDLATARAFCERFEGALVQN
jgi:hypothetical protein